MDAEVFNGARSSIPVRAHSFGKILASSIDPESGENETIPFLERKESEIQNKKSADQENVDLSLCSTFQDIKISDDCATNRNAPKDFRPQVHALCRELQENAHCCDCSEASPTWVSFLARGKLAAFVCFSCASVHRMMQKLNHKVYYVPSSVRNVGLDFFLLTTASVSKSDFVVAERTGNHLVNSIFQRPGLPIQQECEEGGRLFHIREKYRRDKASKFRLKEALCGRKIKCDRQETNAALPEQTSVPQNVKCISDGEKEIGDQPVQTVTLPRIEVQSPTSTSLHHPLQRDEVRRNRLMKSEIFQSCVSDAKKRYRAILSTKAPHSPLIMDQAHSSLPGSDLSFSPNSSNTEKNTPLLENLTPNTASTTSSSSISAADFKSALMSIPPPPITRRRSKSPQKHSRRVRDRSTDAVARARKPVRAANTQQKKKKMHDSWASTVPDFRRKSQASNEDAANRKVKMSLDSSGNVQASSKTHQKRASKYKRNTKLMRSLSKSTSRPTKKSLSRDKDVTSQRTEEKTRRTIDSLEKDMSFRNRLRLEKSKQRAVGEHQRAVRSTSIMGSVAVGRLSDSQKFNFMPAPMALFQRSMSTGVTPAVSNHVP